MQIIPLYATSQFVAVADLQPSDVVMELGFAGGEVLLEVLRHQVRIAAVAQHLNNPTMQVQSCIAVDLGEGSTDTMTERLSGEQQVDDVQIRQIELSCLVQVQCGTLLCLCTDFFCRSST
jgi:hypothetical protein